MGSREICFSQNCTKLWKKLDVICLSSILCDWLVRGVILKSQMFADFKKLYYWKKTFSYSGYFSGFFLSKKLSFWSEKLSMLPVRGASLHQCSKAWMLMNH